MHVEVHQWARSVSRLLRGVLPWPKAEFRWDAAGRADASAADGDAPRRSRRRPPGRTPTSSCPPCTAATAGGPAGRCSPRRATTTDVQFDTYKIRRASLGQDKARVRNLIAATDQEAREGSGAARCGRGPAEGVDRARRAPAAC